jgi:acetyl esterase/lipase
MISRLRNGPRPKSITEHNYGSHPAEHLELIPAAPDMPLRSAVVYFHGGGWICGNKNYYTPSLLHLAEAGHPVFNVEYLFAPEHPHPQILLSLLNALTWIRKQHPEQESVHLMGDSAGGNLAMMLGILIANPSLVSILGTGQTFDTPRVHSITSLAGVLDRLAWIEDGFSGASLMLRSYAGEAAFAPDVEPRHAVTPIDLTFDILPPTFIAVGSRDRLARSSRICAEHLEQHFDDVRYKLYEGAGHGFVIFNRPESRELLDDILEFLGAH